MAKKSKITTTTTTTTINNSNSVVCTTRGFLSRKTIFHILGEDVEVSSVYLDKTTNMINMMVATLNVLGKPFLDEIHKNNIFFPNEIEEYLERKFKIIERDVKISSLLK